jgi:hypothetical protein
MLALMAAYAMETIQSKALKKHLVFSIVGASFVVAFIGFLPLLKSLGVQNLQKSGKYLNTLSAVDFEVVSFAGEDAVVNPDLGVPALDIYTHKRLFYEKQQISPQVMERTKTSPLRFTWEYPMPEYYSRPPKDKIFDGLVMISDDPNQPMPESIKKKILQYPAHKIFQQSSNIFQHQTYITVYHK